MNRKLKPYDSNDLIAQQTFNHCYLGKVFFASQERNAWQWSTSRTYATEHAFALSEDALQRQVEAQRKQGSTWLKLELAACVFTGLEGTLIVTEINALNPFKTLKLNMPESPQLSDVAECFVPQDANTIQRFLYSGLWLKPAELPFIHWKSSFRGGKLRWVEDVGNILDVFNVDAVYSIESTLETISRITLWRQSFTDE